eukprot:gnl/Hemi2/18025_TR5954_c0_g1_i1.p1 gnl/Hemi2/18025_TR5954_c0_g1~~gnl/Hemi2/18025_TR5954_c0_g1_i1.p1  ORF type:complete len:457 (+),score=136.92 gnl/Hemi2/18025_TR5954_c0_g1_i1:94-1371(+)
MTDQEYVLRCMRPTRKYSVGIFEQGTPEWAGFAPPVRLTRDLAQAQEIKYTNKKPAWTLMDDENNNHYVGTHESGQTSSYFIFVCQDNEFKVFPILDWYKFKAKTEYKQLTLEEAEGILDAKQKKIERWMMQKKREGENAETSALDTYMAQMLAEDADMLAPGLALLEKAEKKKKKAKKSREEGEGEPGMDYDETEVFDDPEGNELGEDVEKENKDLSNSGKEIKSLLRKKPENADEDDDDTDSSDSENGDDEDGAQAMETVTLPPMSPAHVPHASLSLPANILPTIMAKPPPQSATPRSKSPTEALVNNNNNNAGSPGGTDASRKRERPPSATPPAAPPAKRTKLEEAAPADLPGAVTQAEIRDAVVGHRGPGGMTTQSLSKIFKPRLKTKELRDAFLALVKRMVKMVNKPEGPVIELKPEYRG